MPNGPLIVAVDLRNPPKGGGYGRTHGPTHCFIYIDGILVQITEILALFEAFGMQHTLLGANSFFSKVSCRSEKCNFWFFF